MTLCVRISFYAAVESLLIVNLRRLQKPICFSLAQLLGVSTSFYARLSYTLVNRATARDGQVKIGFMSKSSLSRVRPTAGLATIKTTSSPNLSSAFQSVRKPPPLPSALTNGRRPSSGRTRKRSLPPEPPKTDPSSNFDSQQTPMMAGPGSSPFTMHPPRPTNGRTATDDKNANQNLEVGDVVDVPGSMFGTIKFIGEVKGKKGHFAGVELDKEFAVKGKNDGDVDG